MHMYIVMSIFLILDTDKLVNLWRNEVHNEKSYHTGRTSKFSVLLVLIFLVSCSCSFSACDNQVDVASISVIEESIPQNEGKRV